MSLCFAAAGGGRWCVGTMEVSHRERLSELVEQLTTSGQSQLNESKMKEIKKICKYVQVYNKTYYTPTANSSETYYSHDY